MHSRQRSVSVIVVPAAELQPPGWFAMHPQQYASESERHAAHGRWHCLSTNSGRIYRALQLRSDLPMNGLALDWQARSVLGVEQRGAIAESSPITLELRPARFTEYPRCLMGHPSPAIRLGAVAVVLFLLLVLMVGLGFGYQWTRTTRPALAANPGVVAATADATTFLHTVAGEWRGDGEQLTIRDDQGVVEIIRQTRVDGGGLQLDLHVAAPVQFEPTLDQIELDIPGGRWLLKLVSGTRHTQLVITYPDKRQAVYE